MERIHGHYCGVHPFFYAYPYGIHLAYGVRIIKIHFIVCRRLEGEEGEIFPKCHITNQEVGGRHFCLNVLLNFFWKIRASIFN